MTLFDEIPISPAAIWTWKRVRNPCSATNVAQLLMSRRFVSIQGVDVRWLISACCWVGRWAGCLLWRPLQL